MSEHEFYDCSILDVIREAKTRSELIYMLTHAWVFFLFPTKREALLVCCVLKIDFLFFLNIFSVKSEKKTFGMIE